MGSIDMRREYIQGGLLDLEMLDASPFRQFEQWFDDAHKAELCDPQAMVLATTSPNAVPSQRIVLLRTFDSEGFVFFTNLVSRKANDIAANAVVSLLFPWHALDRQVIVSGRAEQLARDASLAYFQSRPRGSQIAAWASPQGQPIATRQWLSDAMAAREQEFDEGEVPLPDFWGGYLVRPTRFEFWQGRENRLHDRFEYWGQDDSWRIRRLAP